MLAWLRCSLKSNLKEPNPFDLKLEARIVGFPET